MYKLKRSYGKKTFEQWEQNKTFEPRKQNEENIEKREYSLGSTRTGYHCAKDNEWPVSTFPDLVEKVAFLSAMNKRLVLFYRGQAADYKGKLLPMLYRKGWKCFCCQQRFNINHKNRYKYWDYLEKIGPQVFDICHKDKDLGLPRWRGLRDIWEVQWSIIQHYELWPTPLIDVTSSLRSAASFAMNHREGTSADPCYGYLYVVGLPQSTGSITFDIDQHVVIARLQSSCPPVAKRPHYQEGFLVGHFPTYEIRRGDEQADKDIIKKADLARRLVATFKLEDKGCFWDKEDFPVIQRDALSPPPEKDPLLRRFREEFGGMEELSVHREAQKLECAIHS